MDQGAFCILYKTCKICEQTKYILEFSSLGKRRRRSYCHDCRARRHEKILTSTIPYRFDPSHLSAPIIKVRGKGKKRRFEYEVSLEKAKQLVLEGAAGIVHETLIHLLYDKAEFRSYIKQRSNFTCFYCGQYGDTIDHIIPKSKGGLTTPKNCVCACESCNQRKRDLPVEEFLQVL